MSNTFASLMALSATQTKEQENAVESALRERQRKEALRRKQQEEKEAKDREMEKQRRIKMFEDQKRDEERRKRQEEAKKAQELAFKRREEEEKNRLLYGPKKAAKLASSSSPSSSDHKNKGRRRSPDDDDDGGPIPLTREELRERKQRLEMNRLYGSASKKGSSSQFGGTQRAGRRLPGGAVDITTSSTSAQGSSGDHRSVRDRLAAMPNTLVKLNQNKRDTRTIDEILQDRQKAKEAKVLEGDQALVFDDWFGTKKKDKEKEREKEKEVKPMASRMSSAAPSSGANTPSHSATTSQLVSSQKKAAAPPKPLPSFRPTATSKAAPNGASQPRGPAAGPSRADRLPDKMKSLGLSKSSKSSHSDHHSSSKLSSSTSSKKRARSISRSESPPPKRKHRPFIEDDDELDVSAEIWKMFGKNRNTYVSRDVMSDDEDMEADAGSLEQEELRSYRIAQREEQAALEEERRHEEEKRRRKKLLARGGA